MTIWLYNSDGEPITFVKDERFFSNDYDFIGRLNGNEVWHGKYKGEIVRGDRFLYKAIKASVISKTPGILEHQESPALLAIKV